VEREQQDGFLEVSPLQGFVLPLPKQHISVQVRVLLRGYRGGWINHRKRSECDDFEEKQEKLREIGKSTGEPGNERHIILSHAKDKINVARDARI